LATGDYSGLDWTQASEKQKEDYDKNELNYYKKRS
jgi:hypothetical protein